MDELIKYLHIPELIIKSLDQDLNPEEKNELEEWIKKSPENKILFENLNKQVGNDKREAFANRLNKKDAWKRINRETSKSNLSISQRFMKYAAVVMIPLLLGIAVFNIIYKESKELEKLSLNDIKPGTNKARLILAEGTIIDLEKKKDIILYDRDGNTIINKNSKLELKSKNTESSATVPKYNVIEIPRGGEYAMLLSDGTKVWLNSDTRLKFPKVFSGKIRKVILEGEAYFEVSHNPKKPFIVETRESNVEVLGTKFNVKSYKEEENIYTTLVEGSVRFSDKSKESTCILKPGEQSVYNPVKKELEERKVSTELFTAWVEGRFAFDNERLEEILMQLSRWYDVEIFFQNNETRDYRFTGNLKRYDSISTILQMLEVTYDIKFRIKERSIIVIKK